MKTLLLPLLLCFGLAVQTTFASHFLGGQIAYESLGSNEYAISLSVYRDCSGAGFGSSNSVRISWPSGSQTLSVTRTSILDRTILCNGQLSYCSGGPSSNPGIEEHIYEANVTLVPLPAGQKYTLSWDGCCRPGNITNIVSPSNQAIYMETILDPNIFPQNSSPKFLTAPAGDFCIGQASTIATSGSDADGDELVYSLVGVRTNAGTYIPYQTGLSATLPFHSSTGVTIDANTGLISFNPSSQQIAVIGVLVQEFRTGVLIGEVYRDFEVKFGSCTGTGNVVPVVSTIPNATININQNYTQVVSATDANSSDVITLEASSGAMPPATFAITSSGAGFTNGLFSYTPTANDAGRSFTVAVTATDDNCPVSGLTLATFNVTVANALFTDPISGPFCTGDVDNVTFSSGSVVYNPSNVFTAQLSNSSGAFVSPVNIGSISSSSTTGSIPITIPSSAYIGSGTGYRIRVVSSDPVVIGTTNGADIAIGGGTCAPDPAGGIHLDGVDDQISLGNARIPAGLGDHWTISAWARPDAVGTVHPKTIISQYNVGSNGRMHIYEASGNWTFVYNYTGGDIVQIFGTAQAGVWNHLTVTYDNATLKFYVDGVLTQTVNGTLAGSVYGSTPTRIGISGTDNAYCFNGRIDEVRFWDYALCVTEINATKNCELTGSETGLISYYKMNHGIINGNNSGLTTVDDATNNQDGILSGSALSGPNSNWDVQAPAVSGNCGIYSCVNTWTGTTDSDWNDPTNWSVNAIPTLVDEVNIPTLPSGGNMPTVNIAGAVVLDITIENGATLTILPNMTLKVDGVLTNNGDVYVNNNGSLLQTTGSTLAGGGEYHVTRDGRTGQQFNLWSSPITAQSGVPGNPSYAYDPTAVTQWTSDDAHDPGWGTGYNGLMTPGVGYAGRGGGAATFNGTVNNGSVDVTIVHPTAYVTPALDPTQGQPVGSPFNLVGNPYPSAINAAQFVDENRYDIEATIYFWNDDNSAGSDYDRFDFAEWNWTGGLTGSGNPSTGGGPNMTPNGFIASAQGFYVRVKPGHDGTLNFNNAQRRAGNNGQFLRTNGDDSRLWLRLQNDSLFNQILIGVLEDATTDEDDLYDAVKMRDNTDISMSAVANDLRHSIMAFPPPAVNSTVPLRVQVAEEGTYSFVPHVMEGFDAFDVYLTDVALNTNVLLEEEMAVPVQLTEGLHENRFFLNLVRTSFTGIEDVDEEMLTAYAANGLLHVGCTGCEPDATIQLIDMSGRIVLEEQNPHFNGGNTIIPINRFSTGVYVVRITTQNQVLSQKIINQ